MIIRMFNDGQARVNSFEATAELNVEGFTVHIGPRYGVTKKDAINKLKKYCDELKEELDESITTPVFLMEIDKNGVPL